MGQKQMIDNNQKALLELLKASLFGMEPVFPDDVDWDAVLAEAKAQTVVALAAKAVPAEYASEWQNYALQSQAQFVRMLHGQTQLVNLLEQAGISLVILKGTAAAMYYPEPARRAMGDIDFLVSQEHFDEALCLMKENGYHLFSNVERHAELKRNGIEYELHHRYSHKDLDVEDYLVDGLNHRVWVTIDNYRFPMLPKLPNGLVLLEHLRHHLKTGLGLRQVIDWMMYVNQELDDSFWKDEFCAVAKEKGLTTLAKTVTRMCQAYLGLSDRLTWCSSADDNLCDSLLELLFSSGNFGIKTREGASVETVSMRFQSMGFFRYLQTAGQNNWEAYQRHPYLKPLCWLYQICRITKRGIATGRGTKITGDINRGKERYELLKELNIM